jgi:hypothetical protein
MLFRMEHLRFWRVAAAGMVLFTLVVPMLPGREEPSIEELKSRLANAGIGDRPALCIRISDLQLGNADRLYVAGDSEKAQSALADVVRYSEQARDYAIQSHKREKQSEIAIRKMARKLADIKHTVSHEDQGRIQNTIDRLQRIRDDLLTDMFPKGVKK